MNITYKRDARQSYLILTAETPSASAYPARMLTENTLHGILPCRIARLDGEEQWYFSVSGYTSLGDHMETGQLSYPVLRALVLALLQTAEELERYLLSPDALLLSPEFCFLSSREEQFAFVYDPEKQSTFREELQKLAQALLPYLDRADSRAVLFGYAFFRRMSEEEASLEALRGVLVEVGEEATPEKQEVTPPTPEEEERAALFDSLFGEEKEERSWFTRLWERLRKKKEEGAERTKDPVAIRISPALDTERPRAGAEAFQTGSHYFSEETTLLAAENDASAVTSPTWYLRATAPGSEPQEIPLFKERHLIGKEEAGADIPLSAPTISRLHALLSRQNGTYAIRDLLSKNGTKINGILLPPRQIRELQEGDEICFADLTYCIYNNTRHDIYYSQ